MRTYTDFYLEIRYNKKYIEWYNNLHDDIKMNWSIKQFEILYVIFLLK